MAPGIRKGGPGMMPSSNMGGMPSSSMGGPPGGMPKSSMGSAPGGGGGPGVPKSNMGNQAKTNENEDDDFTKAR